MKRRIFLWMGLVVLFASFGLFREGTVYGASQVPTADNKAGISQKEDGATHQSTVNVKKSGKKSQNNGTARTQNKKNIAKSSKSSPSPEVYRVKKGDTLVRIAKQTGVSVTDLKALNRLKGSSLKIGQTLVVRKRAAIPAGENAAAEPILLSALGDPDEEEEDGGITDERAWAQIERHKRESEALLGNWSTPEEPKLLVKVATGFLGAPYRLGGSSVRGIDCSGFVKKIYAFFNIDLPRTAFEQSHVGMPVSRSQLVEGDLLFFHTRRAVGHVGIYIGNDEFVHASSRKRGVRIDNLNMPYYNKRFVRAVRLKGSDEGL